MAENFAAYKSAAGVVAQFRAKLDQYVLKSEDILDDTPTSWTNIFGSMIGELAGNSFFENQAYLREINESTAIKEKSLLHKLSDEAVVGIYGQPANLTFMLGYPEKDILNLAQPTQFGDRRLRVGHDLKMWVDDYPKFTLDHNLDIVVTTSISGQLTIGAEFDMADLNGLSAIQTPFVNVQNGVNINGVVYSVFHIPMRQYQREITEYSLTNQGADRNIIFTDNLMGFEVYYRAVGATEWSKLTGAPMGTRISNGYNYTIETKIIPQKIKIQFSPKATTFDVTNGTIRIVAYTTKGVDGNFTLANAQSSVDGLQIEMGQDNTDPFQSPVTQIRPLISIRENKSMNGKNAMSVEEIREKVIAEKGSGSKVLSLAELTRKVAQMGLTPYKTKSDVFGLEFRVAGPAIDPHGIMVPTTMADLRFTETDIPIVAETRSRLITPRHVFQQDPASGRLTFKANPAPYSVYAELYNEGSGLDFSFPFFIRVEASDQLDAKVYDLSHDAEYKTSFTYFNERSSDRLSVETLSIARNPIIADEYVLSFRVNANQNLINSLLLMNPADYPLAFRAEIKNASGGERFAASTTITRINAAEAIIECESRLKTNDAISTTGKICITESSLSPVPATGTPISFYFIEKNIHVSLYGLLKGSSAIPTIHDDILSATEKTNGWYVSTIFSAESIDLFEDYTDIFRPTIDIQLTQPVYAVYDQVIYEKYTEDVYELENGIPKMVETIEQYPDGTQRPVKSYSILHHKDDLVLNAQNQPIVKYNIGDVKMTSTGSPEVAVPPKRLFILRTIPIYNRIYAAASMYTNAIYAFGTIISKITSLTNIVDGASMKLGVKKTTGRGGYKFTNLKTKVVEILDDMALSLSLSVRPKNAYSIADTTYFLNSIKESIIDKIVNNNSLTFSFMKMLEEVKASIPNIDYFELKRVNNYEPGICQTIVAEEGSVNDQILGIRYVVDFSSSDISMEQVVLKPAIEIDILS